MTNDLCNENTCPSRDNMDSPTGLSCIDRTKAPTKENCFCKMQNLY